MELASALHAAVTAYLDRDWCGIRDNGQDAPGMLIAFYDTAAASIVGSDHTVAAIERKGVRGKAGEARESDRFWLSAGAGTNLYGRMIDLLVKIDAATKKSPEWIRQTNELYDALRAWDGSDREDKTIYFLEKCVLYRAFVTSAVQVGPFTGKTEADYHAYMDSRKDLPPMPERGRALRDAVAWLDSSAGHRVYEQRRVYWLGQLFSLLTAAESAGLDKGELSDLLLSAKHPVLNVYGSALRIPGADAVLGQRDHFNGQILFAFLALPPLSRWLVANPH
ncbi:hypothetical protein F183_A37860 [Bryobacterales bacterium F-183]|nr:hypothetical protein F183_A37860 [Bryobacterales bacterium F-183]